MSSTIFRESLIKLHQNRCKNPRINLTGKSQQFVKTSPTIRNNVDDNTFFTFDQCKRWNPTWEKPEKTHATKTFENEKRVSREDGELLSTSAKRNCGDKANVKIL